MKRKVIMGILVMAALTLGACGNQEETSNTGTGNTGVETQVQTVDQSGTDSEEEQKEENSSSSNVEVSMEALRNHEVTPGTDFKYFTDTDGIMITKYLGNDEIVVIPEEIDGKRVQSIAAGILDEDSPVKAIKLSDSVETIEKWAFFENTNLEYVICGSSLKTIGKCAFMGCTSLKELEINEGFEKFSTGSISSCDSLKVLYIPESVTEFGGADIGVVCEGFTIQGKTGSAAETYANNCGFNFEAVD